ncbi:hypothetical protein [Sorangium sp. So ce128]|uniref:hypothetical protein n=1 Tax=Sorangium sp. So ce128 TaxID=3133281 RepID=UPI003F5EF2DE
MGADLPYRLNPLKIELYQAQPNSAITVVEALRTPPEPSALPPGSLSPRRDFIMDGRSRLDEASVAPAMRTPNRDGCSHECLDLGMEGAVRQERSA